MFIDSSSDSGEGSASDNDEDDEDDTASQNSSTTSSSKKTPRAGQKRKAVPDNSEGKSEFWLFKLFVNCC